MMRWMPISEPAPTSDRPLSGGGEVQAMAWPQFLRWFSIHWEPGQHVSVICPTGAGKTTMVSPLLFLRRYVLVIDAKGGDETLEALGFKRLARWPGEKQMTKMVEQNNADGKPSRYIVGMKTDRTEDVALLRQTIAACLRDVFNMGGWTVYLDELQVTTDRRMMNLSGAVARLLVAARSKGITVISAFQAPSWVPTEAVRQPTWIVTGPTRDTDTVNRMAEVMGRPKAEMRGFVKALPDFTWGVVGRNARSPFIITRPPYIAPVTTRR